MIENYNYQCNTLQLNPGDAIITFTDGVTEACSTTNELYGESRLKDLLPSLSGKDAKDMVDAIHEAVCHHAEGAEQSDDITIMSIKKI